MVTVWRRAFCMSIRRDPETTSSATILDQQQQQQSASPSSSSSSSCVKLGMGIFSGSGGGGSNPSSNQSTPRLCSTTSTPRCQATSPPTTTPPKPLESTRLQCKTTAASNAAASSSRTTPRTSSSSTLANSKESPRLFRSSSPRSPSRFALFKTALRLSRNRCGICGESVRSNVGAVFTAECSHAFHFPCISSHVRSQGCLVCPVCSITWHDAPLLASSLHPPPPPSPSSANASASAGRPRSSHSSNRNRWEGKKAFPTAASINSKIYDDDESLQLSPTSRVADGLLQFNPIPEEAEDSDKDAVAAAADDDDNDEYQHKEDVKQEGELQRVPALSVVPDCLALVSTSRNHLTYVVSIKVKAPPLPQQPQDAAAAAQTLPVIIPQSLSHNPSSRAPIDLVTVLDVSGNMTATKLQMLKRAMRLVISSLGPGDRLSIVAFSVAAAKRLFRLRRMSRTGQRSARQIVDRLVICGTTQAQAQAQTLTQGDFSSSSSCMGNALRKATKILEDRRERNPVATIMLLSDVQCQGGHDQQKEQNLYATTPRSSRSRSNQASSATRFTHIEIPIHASASFHKQQQQKRMPSPPDNGIIRVMEEENVFAKCMNGLVSVVLLDVHLQFSLPSASGVISSVYSYSYGGGGECDGGIGQAFSHGEGGKSVSLGDMYAVEERQLLVELKVPKTALIEGHAMFNMSIMCNYRDPLTRDVIHKPHVLPIPMPLQYQDQNHRQMNNQFPVLLHSYSSSSSTTMTVQSNQVEQQQLKNLFVTTRAVAESRHLVELSDFDTAIHLLSSARSVLLQQSATAVGSNTQKKLVIRLEAELQGLKRVQLEQQQQQRLQQQHPHSLSPSHRRWSEQALLGEARGNGGGGEPLTPTSAWRAAEQLAKVAITRKSLNQVSDLHGLENARF